MLSWPLTGRVDVLTRGPKLDSTHRYTGSVLTKERDMPRPITARPRLNPPDLTRVPINVHSTAREAVQGFLVADLAGTGIGYSEFIAQSIELWRERGLIGPMAIAARPRWTPPGETRVPMNIHPDVRAKLRSFLVNELAATGVGYSEFVYRSVGTWRAAA